MNNSYWWFYQYYFNMHVNIHVKQNIYSNSTVSLCLVNFKFPSIHECSNYAPKFGALWVLYVSKARWVGWIILFDRPYTRSLYFDNSFSIPCREAIALQSSSLHLIFSNHLFLSLLLQLFYSFQFYISSSSVIYLLHISFKWQKNRNNQMDK